MSDSHRLEDLRSLRDDLRSRMADAESDQNFAVMGRLLVDVLKQIDEAAGSAGGGKGKVGDELAARRARATGTEGAVSADGGRKPRTR